MKIMDRIPRLFGRRVQVDPDPDCHSLDFNQFKPILDRRAEKPSELSAPLRPTDQVQNDAVTSEEGAFEELGREARPNEHEFLEPLAPSEMRLLFEGADASLEQFAISPRLHATDAKGDTPLHIAARTGNLVLCDLFVRSGSDPRALNNERLTPADVALAEGHDIAARLLYSLVSEPLQPEQIQGAIDATFPASSRSARDDLVRRAPEGNPSMSWSDDRVQLLKTLWAEGRSANQIARVLGDVSRNAVVGKAKRLGLRNRALEEKQSFRGAPDQRPVVVSRDSFAQSVGRPIVTCASPDKNALDDLDVSLCFEAEVEPEEFFEQNTGDTASGTFVALVNSSSVVSDDEDGDSLFMV